ncbi:hypothetical protein C8A01DRAFT_47835 [Parachaetomium inaequale]|uniref:non-specific serine/threonine protein kinase n=1 Tax=Parachaetomium inaequale TaxID=2588326 RepID=A0AAN6SPT2_9PEZI|nr:hypothetical protein C8A01DRAFT_47835 [Parachaetomium inaequale]
MDPLNPDLGRFFFSSHAVCRDTHVVHLYDPDTRRNVHVTLPNPGGFDPPPDDPLFLAPDKDAADALTEHNHHVPPETVGIEVDETGRLVSFDTDPKQDTTEGTDHLLLEQYQLPPPIANKTVLRSELTEIRRFTTGVDVVAYPPSLSPSRRNKNRYVFKYATSLPGHPDMVLLDQIVLDEVTKSRVVGFTIKYIPSETLDKHRPLFKLRWLKQLMQTVDDLNLKYGIIHQDIAHRNLIIDPNRDSIVLIDFNLACRGVLVSLYEFITRDPALQEYALNMVDDKNFMDPAKWVKHPDVELDDEVAEFYFELMAWVRRRRAGKQLKHYTEAPEHVDWPDVLEIRKGREFPFTLGGRRTLGLPYLHWKRPSSSNIDPTRRLLATGRYADEEAAAQKAAAEVIAAAKAAGPPILPWRAAEPGELAPIIPWSPGQVFVPVVPPKAVDAKVGPSVVRPRQEREEWGAEVSRGVQRPQRKRKEEGGVEVGGRVLRPRPTEKRKEARGDAGPVIAADKPVKKQRASKRSGAALLSAMA